MSLVFFVYTLALLVICALTASVCVSAHLVCHRKVFLYAAGMFLLYLFDVSFIFQEEFLSQNLVFDSTQYYAINYPILKMIVGGGFLQCLWLIVCDYLDVHNRTLEFGPLVAFFAGSLAVLFLLPEGPWRQYLYYSMRQVFLIFISLYGIYRRKRATDPVEVMRLERFRRPFIACSLLVLCILCEDTVVILALDPGFITSDFPLYLSERNFSENIMLLVFAWFSIRESAHRLALRFERPPQREDVPIEHHIEELLPVYCRRYGLSEREGEVLHLILLGRDNQNIANELTLALGTIKAHVHNILKKTNQENRENLKRDFWKG